MENIEKSRRKKFPVAQTVLHVVLVFLLFIMLYPLAMALWNAFKSDIAYDYTRWYPTLPLRIRNVSTAFDMTSKYMLNTVVVGVAGTAGMLAISSLASFAFAKMKFPGRSFFLSMVLALMMVPGVLTLVPSYILYKTLGLHDNLMALILPIWTGGCIFAVFLLTTFFSGAPERSVRGCADRRRVAVPLLLRHRAPVEHAHFRHDHDHADRQRVERLYLAATRFVRRKIHRFGGAAAHVQERIHVRYARHVRGISGGIFTFDLIVYFRK